MGFTFICYILQVLFYKSLPSLRLWLFVAVHHHSMPYHMVRFGLVSGERSWYRERSNA